MKRETALGLGLKLLGISLMVFPLLIALQMHDWDIQAAVFDTEGFDRVTGQLLGAMGENVMPPLQLGGASVDFDNATNRVRITLPFPPLPFSATITDITFSASVGGVHVDLTMEEENVESVPGEDTIVHLVGTMSSLPASSTLSVSEGSITFEKLGVTITTRIVQPQGGST